MPLYRLGDDTPKLGRDVFVAPGAHVIGRVDLGDGVGVWFGAVLRGDNEWITVGDETNIQDNVTMHSDMGSPLTIGAGCTIGHGAIVHGCTIDENCLIGMGATILNGARIGAGSIVGAGALVTEGKAFEPGSLIVGAPAKTVRRLDEAATQALRSSASHYVDKARLFRRDLEIIAD